MPGTLAVFQSITFVRMPQDRRGLWKKNAQNHRFKFARKIRLSTAEIFLGWEM